MLIARIMRSRRRRYHLVWWITVLLLLGPSSLLPPTIVHEPLLLVESVSWETIGSWAPWYGRHNAVPKPFRKKRKWSAMFTVDPSAILSTLVKAGGIFIPESYQNDMQILRECLHCARAEMNVVEKTMILYNWTIGLMDDEQPCLSVGRAYVHWDSYTQPTIYMQVDDVTLLVEFRNLLLTKSNWQALASRGFPPEIAVASRGSGTTLDEYDLVRLGSLDLSGKARVCIKSKPLNKELGVLEMDMDSFDDFTRTMEQASENRWQVTGRRGLTPPEVGILLQQYFTKKIRAYVYKQYGGDMSNDITTNDPLQDAKGFVYKAAGSVLNYATDASLKKGNDLQEKVAARLGISNNRLASFRNSLQKLNATAARIALADFLDASSASRDEVPTSLGNTNAEN